jgi:hypothetical protein
MPILAISAMSGKNTTVKGQGIAYGLTLLAMAILVTVGQTAFKGGSLENAAITTTGLGLVAIDTIAVGGLLMRGREAERIAKEQALAQNRLRVLLGPKVSEQEYVKQHLAECTREREAMEARETSIIMEKGEDKEVALQRAKAIIQIERRLKLVAVKEDEFDNYDTEQVLVQARLIEDMYRNKVVRKLRRIDPEINESTIQQILLKVYEEAFTIKNCLTNNNFIKDFSTFVSSAYSEWKKEHDQADESEIVD